MPHSHSRARLAIGLLLSLVAGCGSKPGIRKPQSRSADAQVITKNVLAIDFDPLLPDGTTLTNHLGWTSASQQAADHVALFQRASNNRAVFNVATTISVRAFPQKSDGFTYDIDSYLAVLADNSKAHDPDSADVPKIFRDYDVCGRVNRGEIDEVWLFGAGWFGFYESQLAGPGGYWFNSAPLDMPDCQRLVPVMGFNKSRNDTLAHAFAHRMESTMSQVYGGWNENDISTPWNRFALVAAQSPAFGFSGCGSTHYPPNGTHDYDYANTTAMQSFCHSFRSYPALPDPRASLEPIDCSAWGCTQPGYFQWWFSQLPDAAGTAPDGNLANWWVYFMSPAQAIGAPPSCRSHDGDVNGCNAASGCAYYLCSNQCWPRGTSNDVACGSCPGGIELGGRQVTGTSGQRVCGTDRNIYVCDGAQWQRTSERCAGGQCRCDGGARIDGSPIAGDDSYCGMTVCGGGGVTYVCGGHGWVGTSATCSSPDEVRCRGLSFSDCVGDCAWYTNESSSCWPRGTPNDVAASCICTGGIRQGGAPIAVDQATCNEVVVGSDGRNYRCTGDGWRAE